MKLNLGCGWDQKDGWHNVDASPLCKPDAVCDLETTPWPFETSSADEILMSHVLEHIGQDPKVYLAIIKELYRVCKADGTVTIIVPHPRNDDFLLDPTHVRPVLAESFLLFSKTVCEGLVADGAGDTPLALMIDVDFELVSVNHHLEAVWRNRLSANEITQGELEEAIRCQNNVIKETTFTLRAVK